MRVKWPMVLYCSVIPLGCKSTREPILMPQPRDEATEEQPTQELPTQAKPTADSTASPPLDNKVPEPVDLCATNPDLYQKKDGKCVLIPLPSVEGKLDISSGIIWKPDLSRCRSPAFNGEFKFCSGGVHASIPLALPTQGPGKVRFSLRFNCRSFPSQNSLELSIADVTKVTLASVLVDTPIFADEISVEAGVEKSVRLDFTPIYEANYPPDCLLYLIENRIME